MSNAFRIRPLYLVVDAYYVREVRTHPRIAATVLDFGFPGSYFSENGSTRGVLIDGTSATNSSGSNRYLLDNMSCARAIDDTAVNNL